MKSILSAAVLAFASVALVSCGSKDGEAEVSAASHAEIADGVVETMSTMMTEMAAIKDVPSAEALAAKMPEVKSKMKGFLEAAQSLPAPTAEEKAAFQEKMNVAQEKAGPAMMAMMMGMSQNPDAEAIGKVMEGFMDDDEMEKVVESIENIYKVEGGAEAAPAE